MIFRYKVFAMIHLIISFFAFINPCLADGFYGYTGYGMIGKMQPIPYYVKDGIEKPIFQNLNSESQNVLSMINHTEETKRNRVLLSYINSIRKYKNLNSDEAKIASINLAQLLGTIEDDVFRESYWLYRGFEGDNDFKEKAINRLANRAAFLQKLKAELGPMYDKMRDFNKKFRKYTDQECVSQQQESQDFEKNCITASYSDLHDRYIKITEYVLDNKEPVEVPSTKVVETNPTAQNSQNSDGQKCDLAKSDTFLSKIKPSGVLENFNLPIEDLNNNISTCKRVKFAIDSRNGIKIQDLTVLHEDSNEPQVLSQAERKNLYLAIYDKIKMYPSGLLKDEELISLMAEQKSNKLSSKTLPAALKSQVKQGGGRTL